MLKRLKGHSVQQSNGFDVVSWQYYFFSSHRGVFYALNSSNLIIIVFLYSDGIPLQRNRVKSVNGNITIENLRRSDFGFYQCVVSNEVATIVSGTQLVIEGTQPHAPHNITTAANENSITISWMPGYSGGPEFKQEYTLFYREAGASEWTKIQVSPSDSTSLTINTLSSGKTYEFQVISKNALGDGMMSNTVTIRTLGKLIRDITTFF